MTTNLVYLPIDCLYPHPDNPRKELGDLTELADSIKAKGVLQNLTVVKGHAQTQDECHHESRNPPSDQGHARGRGADCPLF